MKLQVPRSEVYAVIDGEREYQNSLRAAGRFSEDVLPVPAELVCMEVYLDKAKLAYTGNPGEAPVEVLHAIRKVVAIGVRALEHYGAPPR